MQVANKAPGARIKCYFIIIRHYSLVLTMFLPSKTGIYNIRENLCRSRQASDFFFSNFHMKINTIPLMLVVSESDAYAAVNFSKKFTNTQFTRILVPLMFAANYTRYIWLLFVLQQIITVKTALPIFKKDSYEILYIKTI